MKSNYKQLINNHDPLCDFFRRGAKYFSVTNHHIYLLEGRVNPEIMKISLMAVIEEFEVFAKRFKSTNKKISHVEFEDTNLFISFSSKKFREHLLQKCSSDESDGFLKFPIRLYFFYSKEQDLTCMHLAITHDVADIKSGNIFVSRLMNAYGGNLSSNGPSFTSSLEGYKDPSMKDIVPEYFRPLAIFKRRIVSNICIIYRIFSADRTLLVPSGIRSRDCILSKGNKKSDFVHHILSDQLQAGIRRAAKFYDVTINTIFSGALVLYICDTQYFRKSSANFTIAVSLRKNGLVDMSGSFRTFMVDCKVKIRKYSNYSTLLSVINKK
jgi:NRPS condensation-like uncharacterized protein